MNTLNGLVRQKDRILLQLLENKLQLEDRVAAVERENYKILKRKGKMDEQLTYLLQHISDQSKETEKLLTEKQTLQNDLNDLKKFFHETKEELEKFRLQEVKYERVCQQLQGVQEELQQEQDTSQQSYDKNRLHPNKLRKSYDKNRTHQAMEALRQKQNTSQYMYNMCGYCIVAVVFSLVAIIFTFSYCLEDEVNHNIKQCTRAVLDIATDYVQTLVQPRGRGSSIGGHHCQ
jgi:chromosome segregation ATPase